MRNRRQRGPAHQQARVRAPCPPGTRPFLLINAGARVARLNADLMKALIEGLATEEGRPRLATIHARIRAALRQMDELKTTLNFAARIILFITLPATVGLIILRHEIIEVLFQHGDFDAASTALTAWALPFFAVGLSAFSMVKIIVSAFYALEDTRTPVKIAFVAMFLNVALNFLFIRPLRNGGPALATSMSAFFNSFALLTVFYRRYGSFGVQEIVQSILKFAIASVVLGAVVYTVIHWPGFYRGPLAQRAVALAVSIAAGTASYFSAAALLSTRELAELKAVRRAQPGVLV